MLKKPKWQPFAILFCFLIEACATVPPDVPACRDLPQRLSTDPVSGHLIYIPSPTCEAQIGEPSCGYCVWIVSGKEAFIGEDPGHELNAKTWSQIQSESVYLPAAESYAPLSTYIIDSCAKMNCNSQIDAYRVKLNSLNGIAGAIQNP